MAMFDEEIDLDPGSNLRASLPEEVRRRSLIMEKVRHVYFAIARDKVLRRHFDRLLEDLSERREPDRQEEAEERAERLEGNMVVVLGESGAGKSAAVRRLLAKHPIAAGKIMGKPGCPVLTVRVPSPCSVGELGRVVLRRTKYKLKRTRVPAPEIWGIVRERIQEFGILVIHLDEFQDAHETLDQPEQVKLRHLLRSLLVDEDYPIGLVISGQPEFEDFIRPDRSSVRRGQWQLFGRIALGTDGPTIKRVVKELARMADLQVVEAEVEDVIVPRLIHAGCNLFGIVVEEIHDAIRIALEDGAVALKLKHFEEAYAFRTGCYLGWNPYHAADYLALDCTRVLARSDPKPERVKEAPGKAEARKKGKKNGSSR